MERRGNDQIHNQNKIINQMKTQLFGRDKELSDLTRSLSSEGSLRAALILGDEGIGKSALLEKTQEELLTSPKVHLCFSHKASAFSNPLNFSASLARSARSSSELVQSALNDFARKWGSLVISFQRSRSNDERDAEWRIKLAKSFVETLEKSLTLGQVPISDITPVLIFDDLDQYSDDGIDWLTGPFNQAIRSSKLFKRCRFLFSAERHNQSLLEACDRFGFERVQDFNLTPLGPALCEKFARSHGFKTMSGEELKEITQGNPLKLLNIFKKPTTLKKVKSVVMSDQSKKTLPHFSDFTEEEFQHLLFASYFKRVNRYNLEFLCSPRDAAFTYNWLKRQKRIANQEPDGCIIIKQEVRDQIQEFHRQDNPEEAERLNVIATIVDTFIAIFPDSETHWIPVHLQALDSFTKDLCRNLFSEEETSIVLSFIDNHSDQIVFTGRQMSLSPDTKLLIQRFIEVGGGTTKDGFLEKAIKQWELDSKAATERRRRMELEQLNLSEEATDIATQVESLVLLKEKIQDDFKNPKKSNTSTKREYTFSSNKLLLFIGLGTIAASLFSDSFGSYYAALGIAFSLGGFFWPNVEERKTAIASAGAGPRLAIETQHRSLDHRINGLVTRSTSIKENLDGMILELENLGQGLDAPYVNNDNFVVQTP
jgi:hypothetical protein